MTKQENGKKLLKDIMERKNRKGEKDYLNKIIFRIKYVIYKQPNIRIK